MADRKKDIKKQVVFFFLSWLMFVGFAFAAAQSAVTSVINELETGVIDIDLEEYRLDETGKEVIWEDQIDIMPGATISKIPKITNKAMDCWVRAKVKIFSKQQRVDSLSMEQIAGISDDWIKIGEYFYYKKVLESKQSITLFEAIEIPTKWKNEHEQNEIKIIVQVDAVQAKNFTPNFSGDTPWGGLVIEKCIHENGYDLNTFRKEEESSLTVHYEGDARKLIAKPDDFFAQFGTLMPGDEQKGSVEIKNKGKNPVNIFFKTEGLEEADFLEKTELIIKNRASDSEKEETVYEGNLRSREIESYFLLGCYEPSYEGEFIFILKLPEELNNAYSLEKRKVKWYFMAEELNNPSTTSTSKITTTSKTPVTSATIPGLKDSTSLAPYGISGTKYANNNTTSSYPNQSANSNPYKNSGGDGSVLGKTQPKTGDISKVEFFSICSILSLAGTIITARSLKRPRKD